MLRRVLLGLGFMGAIALLVGCLQVVPVLSLKVTFDQMDPHVGQRFEARLIDEDSGTEIARLLVSSIPSSSFNLTFTGLEDGKSYQLDFYADVNGNAAYDAPPIDHAWRMNTGTVTESLELTFTHSTGFTDIDWPDSGSGSSSGIDGVIGVSEYANFFQDGGTGIRVYWKNTADVLTMGLVSPGTGWVAAAFDPVDSMQGANFILATIDDGVLIIEDHFGTGRFSHSKDASQDIIESAGIESGGETRIEFSIPLDSGDAADKTLLLGQTYVLLLAMHSSSDNLATKHTVRNIVQFTLD